MSLSTKPREAGSAGLGTSPTDDEQHSVNRGY